MTKRRPRNPAASVRQRLVNLARAQKEDFQFVLTRYALERLLYRLSQSEHRDVFVLKGAMLFRLWSDLPHRPTRDLDLLGRGDSSIIRFKRIFRGLCELAVAEDGLVFSAKSVRGETIKERQEYLGLRLTLECRLEDARIPLQIDIAFGDVVIPAAAEVTYPVLLESPAPVLLAYSRESVVAEKFHAAVMWGIANSRMKDFFDLWIMARQFEFQGPLLCQAIGATFARRHTAVPNEAPTALSLEFAEDRGKQTLWQAFVGKGKLRTDGEGLNEVVQVLRGFLMPPAMAVAAGRVLEMVWPASGPWQPL